MHVSVDTDSLDIARPCWLFARTRRFAKKTGLMVYKSVLLHETSPMYAPVLAHITEHKLELVRKGVFVDAEMMFGKGEFRVYLSKAGSHDDVPEVEDLYKEMEAS